MQPLSHDAIGRLTALVDAGEVDEISMVLTVGAYNTFALHPSLWPDVKNDPTIELPAMEAILVLAGIEIPWKNPPSISSDLPECSDH